MKTQTIEWFQSDFSGSAAVANSVGTVNRSLYLVAKGFTAIVPALALVVGIAWAITVPSLGQYLQASLWASGFVFLALAIDSEKPRVSLPIATGIALPVLALLSSYVAPEFALIAGLLVAAWVTASILKR
jgi:hypothetical protein